MKQISTLVPMTQFILDAKYVGQETLNYAKFITTPLRLGFFIPCTLDDVPIQKPITWDIRFKDVGSMIDEFHAEYDAAQSRCLFEGFTLCDRGSEICVVYNNEHYLWDIIKDKNIEYMVKECLELTPTAIQQIYGR